MEMTIEQRNSFIEKNMGIIGDIASPYKALALRTGYQYEDLVNSGVIGMIDGINEYNIEKATTDKGVVPLEAFVRKRILRRISVFIAKPRKGDRLENKVSMNAPLDSDPTNRTTIGDTIPTEDVTENYCNGMDKERVMEILESGILSPVEALAIKGRFIEGLKFRELDTLLQNFLGNPKTRAFYFINTGLEKLRDVLVEY